MLCFYIDWMVFFIIPQWNILLYCCMLFIPRTKHKYYNYASFWWSMKCCLDGWHLLLYKKNSAKYKSDIENIYVLLWKYSINLKRILKSLVFIVWTECMSNCSEKQKLLLSHFFFSNFCWSNNFYHMIVITISYYFITAEIVFIVTQDRADIFDFTGFLWDFLFTECPDVTIGLRQKECTEISDWSCEQKTIRHVLRVD